MLCAITIGHFVSHNIHQIYSLSGLSTTSCNIPSAINQPDKPTTKDIYKKVFVLYYIQHRTGICQEVHNAQKPLYLDHHNQELDVNQFTVALALG